MQLRPITATVILLLIIASLLVAGCTTRSTNQTSTLSTQEQHALLENYLTAYMNETHTNDSISWVLVFNNNSSAYLDKIIFVKLINTTIDYNETFIVFPTIQDATNYWTNYFNAMNTEAYTHIASTGIPSNSPYVNATGHAPQSYKMYGWVVGDMSNSSEYRLHEIQQIDNLIVLSTSKIVS